MRSLHWFITTVAALVLVITALSQAADAGNGGGRGIQRQARDGSCLSAAQPGDAATGVAVGKAVPSRDRQRQCWASTQPAAQGTARNPRVGAWAGDVGKAPGVRVPGKCRALGTDTDMASVADARRKPSHQHRRVPNPPRNPRVAGSGDDRKTGGQSEDDRGMGVSDAEHRLIQELVLNHKAISRTVRDIPGGTETTTTTSRPEMVKTLREHVRTMVERLHQNQPVRMWDPIFRDVFNHAHEIKVKIADTDGGVIVTETSSNAEVVPMIRAHARAVTQFVEKGHAAVRPPWAGRGRSGSQTGGISE